MTNETATTLGFILLFIAMALSTLGGYNLTTALEVQEGLVFACTWAFLTVLLATPSIWFTMATVYSVVTLVKYFVSPFVYFYEWTNRPNWEQPVENWLKE